MRGEIDRSKRSWFSKLFTLAVVLAAAYFALFLFSARIPDRWQELTAGMSREEVREFLTHPSTTVARESDRQDAFRVKRLIGDWLLLVSYYEGSFSSAHLRYSSPIWGEYTRARNYTDWDDDYDVRKNR